MRDLLSGARAGENGRYRASHDLQVERQRPVLHIEEVVADVVVEGQLVPAAHLPQAGQSRFGLQPGGDLGRPALSLSGKGGAGADQAHLAEKDVEQLRQLVKTEPAQLAA